MREEVLDEQPISVSDVLGEGKKQVKIASKVKNVEQASTHSLDKISEAELEQCLSSTQLDHVEEKVSKPKYNFSKKRELAEIEEQEDQILHLIT